MINKTDAAKLAERFAAIITAGDVELLDEIVAADYVQHNPGAPKGRDGLKSYFASIIKAFPDGNATVEDVITDGETLVGRFKHIGTHTGEFMGIAATNHPVEIRTIDIWRVRDNKLAEHWGETNALDLMKQLGAADKH